MQNTNFESRRHLRNSLKRFEGKVAGNAVSVGPEYQMAEISLPAAPGNGANIGFGPAEKQFR